MKENYQKPKMEIVSIDLDEDIIITSGDVIGEGDE